MSEKRNKVQNSNKSEKAESNPVATAGSGGIGFLGCLALLFIALKLTGHIQWSWLWVLAPVWGPPAVVVGIFLCVVFCFVVALFIGALLSAAGYKGDQESGSNQRRK